MRKLFSSAVFSLTLLAVFFFSPLIVSAQQITGSGVTSPNQLQLVAPQPRITIPGVSFTPPENLVQPEVGPGGVTNQVAHVPYLAEYIAAVYKYAVAIASILAAIMIVVGGFQWTASGGSADAISSAKKRIVGAVTGLVIALGSYTLLYTINPELVQFRSLKINVITTVDIDSFDKGTPLDPQIESGVASRLPRGVSPTGPRTAAVIAVEADVGGTNMIDRVNRLGKTGILGSIAPDTTNCPLSQHHNSTLSLAGTVSNQTLDFTGFDPLFQLYGKCLPIQDGWRIIKAMSFTESAHNSSIVNSIGFIGLFQTKTPFCNGYLDPYQLSGSCTRLTDPEVSTMVGTASLLGSVQKIQSICTGGLSPEDLYYFIYLGHQGGLGTLGSVLQNSSCDRTKACKYIYQFWNAKQQYHDNTPPACAT